MKFLESVALDAIYSSKVARLQARELQEELVAVEGEKKLLMEDKLSSFFERIESLEEQLAKERAERQSLAESELGSCLYSLGGASCRTGLGALVTEVGRSYMFRWFYRDEAFLPRGMVPSLFHASRTLFNFCEMEQKPSVGNQTSSWFMDAWNP